MGSCSDFLFASCRLPCYFLKGPLKGSFLNIYLTALFAVRQLKNTGARIVILFFKIFKIESKIRKCKKNSGKIFRF